MATSVIKILVVEDDFQNRQLIAAYLRGQEFEVMLANNGHEALEKLKTFEPTIIVSDISMPHMDGFELYDKVKEIPHLHSVPFIFLTAHVDADKRRRGKGMGSDDYLTKPIEQEDLIASIKGCLKRVQEIQSATEKQLINQVDSLKREILTAITHEVNTPLFIIKLTANLLLDDSMNFQQGELQELLQKIKKSGDRLDSLLKDFLLTVRISSGESKKEYEDSRQTVEPYFVLAHMLPRLQKTITAQGLSFQTDLSPNLPKLNLHVDQVANIIDRLIDNAIKFNKPNGTVYLRSQIRSHEIVIEVADTGIGIPGEYLEKIFEKFFQLNRTTIEQQGTGLGLTIARELARINQGDIFVESEEGAGSKFMLVFPF